MTDKTLGMLGLARRAGKLELGCDCTKESVELNKTRLVLLASDSSPRLEKDFENMRKMYIFHVIKLPYSKSQLSEMLGCSDCAVCGITDISFATEIAKRLAEQTGSENERTICEKLALTQKRRLERRQAKAASNEKIAKHEKTPRFNNEKSSNNNRKHTENDYRKKHLGGKSEKHGFGHSRRNDNESDKSSGFTKEKFTGEKNNFREKRSGGERHFRSKNFSSEKSGVAKRSAYAGKSGNKFTSNNHSSFSKRLGKRKGHK